MTEHLSDQQRAQYKKAFGQFDENGDGKITVEEFSTAMRNMGYNPKDQTLLKMFDEIDKDGSGEIDVDEFVILMGGWNEGWGPACLEGVNRLQESWLPHIFAGIAFICLVVLYLLDFFLPPHLPGRMFVVRERGVGFSRCVFGVACALAFVYGLSAVHDAHSHPHRPLFLTLLLAPISVTLASMRVHSVRNSVQKSMVEHLRDQGSRVELTLFSIVSSAALEENDAIFYRAALFSFSGTGLCCLAAWIPWVTLYGFPGPRRGASSEFRDDEEAWAVLWVSPLVTAFVMFFVALSIALRLLMHDAYSVGGRRNIERLGASLSMDHLGSFIRRSSSNDVTSGKSFSRKTVLRTPSSGVATALQQAEERQHGRLRELKRMLKISAAICICTFGLLMVASDVAIPDSPLGNMIVELLVLLLGLFAIFMMLTFSRLLKRLRTTLKRMPLWRSMMLLLSSDWTHALAVCIVGPVCLPCLLLSLVNQQVRHWRGLLSKIEASKEQAQLRQASTWNSLPSRPSVNSRNEHVLKWFTERVRIQLLHLTHWDIVGVGMKVHIVSIVLAILFLCPLLFNILFAFIIHLIQPLGAGWIVFIVLAVGVAVLMIPTVPTTALYVFGGVVMSQKWTSLPPSYGGFWVGTLLCILVCVLIKLVGRALQYKGFGRLLGSSLSVQHACKLHTPLMCAVESLMREPGVCKLGKAAVLCGVPDWIMGVGAGILRLPLCQVLLGTVPIVVYVSPCVMSGSFYIRKEDGPIWDRAFVAMIIAMGFVSVVFQVAAALAVQRVLNQHATELSKPREEHVELHWLDHFYREIRTAEHMQVRDLPVCSRAVGLISVVVQVAICHVLIWAWSSCFGTFSVADDIQELMLHGENGIVHPAGFACLVAMTASFISVLLAKRWALRGKQLKHVALVAHLRASKEEWMQKWLATTQKGSADDSENESSPQPTMLDATLSKSGTLDSALDDLFSVARDLPPEKFQPPHSDCVGVRAWLRPVVVDNETSLAPSPLASPTQIWPSSPRPVSPATPRLPPEWAAAAAFGEAIRCGTSDMSSRM